MYTHNSYKDLFSLMAQVGSTVNPGNAKDLIEQYISHNHPEIDVAMKQKVQKMKDYLKKLEGIVLKVEA